MKSNKVSIVVPVYNVESYLEQCIKSIICQTYCNIEIILVNDGSTDRSGDLCDEYAQKDNRIRVIHQKNKGLSSARNAGMKAAEGDFYCFIDSDDYIKETYIESLIENVLIYDADIVICEYFIGNNNLYYNTGCNSNKKYLLSSKEALREFFLQRYKGYVVTWNKIYRRSLFEDNGIIFPNGKVHEDCFTTYRLFAAAKRVVFICRPLYYYRQRNNSIMHNIDIENDFLVLKASLDAYNFIKDKNIELDEEAEYRCIISALESVKNIRSWRYKKCLDVCKNNCKNLNWKDNRYLRGQRKIRFFLLMYFSPLYPLINSAIVYCKKIKEFIHKIINFLLINEVKRGNKR